MQATNTKPYDYVSYVPQCDDLGYESETYGMLDYIVDGICYTIADLIITVDDMPPFADYSVYQRQDGHDRHIFTITMDLRGMDESDVYAMIADLLIVREDVEYYVC